MKQKNKNCLVSISEVELCFDDDSIIKLKDVPMAYRQWLANSQGANPKMQDLIKTVQRYNQQKGESE